VTDPSAWSVMWEATDTAAAGGGMGNAYSVAIDKVKWPVRDANNQIIGYEMKWVVFLATGYAQIAVNHGGINVFAFDLKTGVKLWHFSAEYADSVNDIPGPVTLADTDADSFADLVYVGDMNGRLWELNALDGANPNGLYAGKQVPLFNAGIGKPIAVSPAVITQNNHVILVFGTGGADWASDATAYAVYAVDATAKRSPPPTRPELGPCYGNTLSLSAKRCGPLPPSPPRRFTWPRLSAEWNPAIPGRISRL
jgi:Tfp pilus tip-associated adhesin PilY1